jgi:putative lipoic acid-binding regulatory protein
MLIKTSMNFWLERISGKSRTLLLSRITVVGEMPAIELLEATHRFPGKFMFKVIGRADQGFAARVVAAVRDELAETIDPPFRLRHTAGGRHVAVTLEPTVQTVHQVLAVYRRIRRIPGLVMMM